MRFVARRPAAIDPARLARFPGQIALHGEKALPGSAGPAGSATASRRRSSGDHGPPMADFTDTRKADSRVGGPRGRGFGGHGSNGAALAIARAADIGHGAVLGAIGLARRGGTPAEMEVRLARVSGGPAAHARHEIDDVRDPSRLLRLGPRHCPRPDRVPGRTTRDGRRARLQSQTVRLADDGVLGHAQRATDLRRGPAFGPQSPQLPGLGVGPVHGRDCNFHGAGTLRLGATGRPASARRCQAEYVRPARGIKRPASPPARSRAGTPRPVRRRRSGAGNGKRPATALRRILPCAAAPVVLVRRAAGADIPSATL